MPDIEQRFWKKYADRGLQVVAVDPDAYDAESPEGVYAYTAGLGLTYPVGIEVTSTYDEIIATYDHRHPYPVDVLIDRSGRIVYLSREYDPVALEAAVAALMGE